QGGAVPRGNDSIARDPTLYRWPPKGLDQWLREREPGCLDHNMLDRRCARQDRIQRRYKIVGDRTAEAAVGQFDDILLRTRLVAATFENFAVDADITELIHDAGHSSPVCMGQDVPDQRRLAGSEKTGDDGAGHASD